MRIQFALFAVIFAGMVQPVRAEILTIDVTIKSVEVQNRMITITKSSKTKTKDLELEVGKKASITIDGKEASLDSIRPGQTASISYETGLEIITKIKVSGAGSPDSMPTSGPVNLKSTGCWVVWTVSENGESTVTIGRPSEKREPAKETPIRQDDGTVELQFDFETNESVKRAMTGGAEGVTFDKAQKAIVFSPIPAKGENRAMFYFSKTVQLPVTLEYEFEGIEEGKPFLLGVNLRSRDNKEFPFLNLRSNDGFKTTAIMNAAWIESRDSKGTPKFKPLLEERSVELDETKELSFKVPITNGNAKYILELGVNGQNPVALHHLKVRGKLSPTLGIALVEKGAEVLVEKVLPDGLGESVGLKTGDVLTSINGTKPKALQHALELLGKIQIGGEAEIVVKRGSKPVKIGFIAE